MRLLSRVHRVRNSQGVGKIGLFRYLLAEQIELSRRLDFGGRCKPRECNTQQRHRSLPDFRSVQQALCSRVNLRSVHDRTYEFPAAGFWLARAVAKLDGDPGSAELLLAKPRLSSLTKLRKTRLDRAAFDHRFFERHFVTQRLTMRRRANAGFVFATGVTQDPSPMGSKMILDFSRIKLQELFDGLNL